MTMVTDNDWLWDHFNVFFNVISFLPVVFYSFSLIFELYKWTFFLVATQSLSGSKIKFTFEKGVKYLKIVLVIVIFLMIFISFMFCLAIPWNRTGDYASHAMDVFFITLFLFELILYASISYITINRL